MICMLRRFYEQYLALRARIKASSCPTLHRCHPTTPTYTNVTTARSASLRETQRYIRMYQFTIIFYFFFLLLLLNAYNIYLPICAYQPCHTIARLFGYIIIVFSLCVFFFFTLRKQIFVVNILYK